MNSEKRKQIYNEPSLTIEDLSTALYETNNKLKKTIQIQNEFFANISHDLRSPIAAIRSAIEYLESSDDIDENKKKELYSLIDSKTKTIEFMIDEVFLLTKLNTKDDLLKPENIPCGNYLEDFFFTTELNPRFEHINLVLDVPIDFQYNVRIDSRYMNRVLDNLFENAWRHTHGNGCIRLSARVSNEGEIVVIDVYDDGEGISKEDLPHVFERTYMADTSRTPGAKSGAGLGLSICKKIVELLGGSISCESDTGENHGTTFTIKLPVSPVTIEDE